MAEMRASQLKEDLIALRVLGCDAASQILADLRPELLRRVERAARVDWLPMSLDLELCRSVQAVAGDEGLRAWGREAVRRAMDTSILKPLVDTVARVFGLSPLALLKATPQAWKATFRGCGVIQVQPGAPGEAEVRLVDLPEELSDRAFLVSVSGALEATFAAARASGEIRLVEPSSGPVATFAASWLEA